jgi:hypothetical protein
MAVRFASLAAAAVRLFHADGRLALGLVDRHLRLGTLVADVGLAFGRLYRHVRLAGGALLDDLRLGRGHLHLRLGRLGHLHVGLRLAHLHLRLRLRHVHLRLRHPDDDLGLRDVDRHPRGRLADENLGLRLAHRHLGLGLLNRNLWRRLVDPDRGGGLLHGDVGAFLSARLSRGGGGRRRRGGRVDADESVAAGLGVVGGAEGAHLLDGHARIGRAALLEHRDEPVAIGDGRGLGGRGARLRGRGLREGARRHQRRRAQKGSKKGGSHRCLLDCSSVPPWGSEALPQTCRTPDGSGLARGIWSGSLAVTRSWARGDGRSWSGPVEGGPAPEGLSCGPHQAFQRFHQVLDGGRLLDPDRMIEGFRRRPVPHAPREHENGTPRRVSASASSVHTPSFRQDVQHREIGCFPSQASAARRDR